VGTELKVGFEQVDDGEVGGLLAICRRAAFEDPPALRALHLGQLITQAGFADTRLPHDAHHLPATYRDLCQNLTQHGQFALPADEATQWALPIYLQRRASRPHLHDGVGASTVSAASPRCSRPHHIAPRLPQGLANPSRLVQGLGLAPGWRRPHSDGRLRPRQTPLLQGGGADDRRRT